MKSQFPRPDPSAEALQQVARFFHLTVNPTPPYPAEEILRALGCYDFKRQKGGILVVAGDLDLSGKGLIRLPDLSSVIIKGSFYCFNNQLTSLGGAPQTVGGNFSCSNNQLMSLDGAPQTVGLDFTCSQNQLTSLEHAPQKFRTLLSDFGAFILWKEVPEGIRFSPATKARREQERMRAFTEGATVLQRGIKVRRPFHLKRASGAITKGFFL